MWSSPPLIGPGGVSDKLAWGAGLGLRVILIAQAELPNGWGGRLAIDATGPFNGEQANYAVTLGLHYSFRSFVTWAREQRRERQPPRNRPTQRAEAS
jgi:hypothetical protein